MRRQQRVNQHFLSPQSPFRKARAARNQDLQALLSGYLAVCQIQRVVVKQREHVRVHMRRLQACCQRLALSVRCKPSQAGLAQTARLRLRGNSDLRRQAADFPISATEPHRVADNSLVTVR